MLSLYYRELAMSRIIQARLDRITEEICEKLQKQLGWTNSQVVREGIKSLSGLIRSNGRRKLIGQGKYKSGIPDLATNKKYLDDYGK